MQELEPAGGKKPSGQGAQVLNPVPEYVPAGHIGQPSEGVVVLFGFAVPGLQNIHCCVPACKYVLRGQKSLQNIDPGVE